jgi:hypothetical protein
VAGYVSVMFRGRNGLGSVNLAFASGTRRSRALLIQRIFDSISGASVSIADATSFFTSEISQSQIDQTVSNDFSDQLFLAVIELT